MMNDLEASRQLKRALINLPNDYPDGDKAHEAFGYLVLGRLGIKPGKFTILIHEDGRKTVAYED